MKSQAKLRLQQAGRHRRCGRRTADVDWVWRNGLGHMMAHAFEMNVWPRHYANDEPPPGVMQMANYLTGRMKRP